MSKCSMQKKIESLSRKNEELSNTKDYRIKGVAEDKQSEAEETPNSDGFVYIKPDPKYNKAEWGNRGCDFGSFTSQLHKKGDTYTGLVYVQGALHEFSTDGKTGYFRDSAHQIPTNNVDYAALWKECQRIFRMNKSWMGLQTEGKDPAPKKSLNEDSAIAINDIKAALNEVANEVKPNVAEVRVEDNKDFMGPGAMATIFIDVRGDAIWWFAVKTADNSIEVTDPNDEDHDYGKFSNIEELKSIFKKFLQEDIKDSIVSADDPLDGESDEIKTMVRELAEETGNNYSDAEIEDYAPGKGICITFGKEEYYCYADYDDAKEASNESVKNLLDDVGIAGIQFDSIGGIEQFIDTGWFETALRESAENYISDIKDEPGRYEDEFGDLDEEDAIDKYVDDAGDAIEWFKMDFGEDYFSKIVMDNGLVDMDALAEAITEADGPVNELARYDGKEIELPCGYYCYRSN